MIRDGIRHTSAENKYHIMVIDIITNFLITTLFLLVIIILLSLQSFHLFLPLYLLDGTLMEISTFQNFFQYFPTV